MSKGYPSKSRAKRAFSLGYAGRRPRPFYINEWLIDLWNRGDAKRRGEGKPAHKPRRRHDGLGPRRRPAPYAPAPRGGHGYGGGWRGR